MAATLQYAPAPAKMAAQVTVSRGAACQITLTRQGAADFKDPADYALHVTVTRKNSPPRVWTLPVYVTRRPGNYRDKITVETGTPAQLDFRLDAPAYARRFIEQINRANNLHPYRDALK